MSTGIDWGDLGRGRLHMSSETPCCSVLHRGPQARGTSVSGKAIRVGTGD